MPLFKRFNHLLAFQNIGLLILISMGLFGCSDAKLQEPPHEYFYQVGLFGHGRGAVGDLRLNSFYFERQCDSCHTTEVKNHEFLGQCNQCHQPHITGWKKSLLPRNHKALPLINRPYHNQLQCIDCHQSLTNRQEFKITSCQHCHNHQASDIEYAHDLMDEYDYDDFLKPGACLECHNQIGEKYSEYFDLETGESL